MSGCVKVNALNVVLLGRPSHSPMKEKGAIRPVWFSNVYLGRNVVKLLIV